MLHFAFLEKTDHCVGGGVEGIPRSRPVSLQKKMPLDSVDVGEFEDIFLSNSIELYYFRAYDGLVVAALSTQYSKLINPFSLKLASHPKYPPLLFLPFVIHHLSGKMTTGAASKYPSSNITSKLVYHN